MKNILSKIPDIIKNCAVLCFGILLLLYSFSFFQEALSRIMSISAVLMILYGFIELGGPSKILSLFKKNKNTQKPSHYESTHHSDDDDDELF